MEHQWWWGARPAQRPSGPAPESWTLSSVLCARVVGTGGASLFLLFVIARSLAAPRRVPLTQSRPLDFSEMPLSTLTCREQPRLSSFPMGSTGSPPVLPSCSSSQRAWLVHGALVTTAQIEGKAEQLVVVWGDEMPLGGGWQPTKGSRTG